MRGEERFKCLIADQAQGFLQRAHYLPNPIVVEIIDIWYWHDTGTSKLVSVVPPADHSEVPRVSAAYWD